ncbi:type II toxin-antitoxin system VapC family toxin [Candidatus Roizmanbacteria bacterium]|nr:type II toxin-antitoxin system VapC family toxin [Candidatus Roizmanbacteria bacterium]
MKKIIIDTNVILRFLLNDVPEQKIICETLFKKAKNSECIIIIPQIVIFELHFILDKYYHINKEKIVETIKSLISTPYIEVESREVFLSTLTLYETASTSFVDCFLLNNAETQEAELFTFDKKLLGVLGQI